MKTFRPAQESDYPLIYATWLRSLYYGSPHYKQMDRKDFFDSYKQVIALRLNTSKVTVCCLTEDPDVVLGYSVKADDVLHWVYVKRAWRQLGIAKQLIGDYSVATSITKIGKFALNKDKSKLFNPFK